LSRKRLRKSDVRSLSEQLPVELDKKAVVEQDDNKLFVDGELWFFTTPSIQGWIPSLRLLQKQDVLPKLVVDMGAVRFVTRGADIMRPGITVVPSAPKDALVAVVDETHKKPLAVGKLLFSSEVIQSASEGRVVQNIHFVGDELWG
jgi:predicted RNA-binding protein (TIGR00451 family)